MNEDMMTLIELRDEFRMYQKHFGGIRVSPEAFHVWADAIDTQLAVQEAKTAEQENGEILDAPAKVGVAHFAKGIPWSTVIACAQRAHAHKGDPKLTTEQVDFFRSIAEKSPKQFQMKPEQAVGDGVNDILAKLAAAKTKLARASGLAGTGPSKLWKREVNSAMWDINCVIYDLTRPRPAIATPAEDVIKLDPDTNECSPDPVVRKAFADGYETGYAHGKDASTPATLEDAACVHRVPCPGCSGDKGHLGQNMGYVPCRDCDGEGFIESDSECGLTPAEVTDDAMIDAYLSAQRAVMERADQMMCVGDVREACRQGLIAALAAQSQASKDVPRTDDADRLTFEFDASQMNAVAHRLERDARWAATMLRKAALASPSAGAVVPDGWLHALDAAVAAIYFDDSSDYQTALWQVVKHLKPNIVDLLESDESTAYEQVKAMLAAAPGVDRG